MPNPGLRDDTGIHRCNRVARDVHLEILHFLEQLFVGPVKGGQPLGLGFARLGNPRSVGHPRKRKDLELRNSGMETAIVSG